MFCIHKYNPIRWVLLLIMFLFDVFIGMFKVLKDTFKE